jgi:hypothetical protein
LLEYLSLFSFDPSNSLLGHPLSSTAIFIVNLSNGASREEKEIGDPLGDNVFYPLLLRWNAIGDSERGREKVMFEIRKLLEREEKMSAKSRPGSLVCIDTQLIPSPFR